MGVKFACEIRPKEFGDDDGPLQGWYHLPHVLVGVNFVREISIPSLPSGGLIASTGGLCKAGDILRTFLWVSILFVDFGNSLRM